MGIIIIAVAVFDNHIDRKPVATMKPSTSRWGWPPMTRSTWRAMRRCRCHFSTAAAIMKPPMNSRITQSMYWFATLGKMMSISPGRTPSRRSTRLPAGTSRPRMMPSSGNSAMGSSAVAASGIASVIHQVAIKRMTASIRVAAGLPGSRSTSSSVRTKTAGPSQSPMRLRRGIAWSDPGVFWLVVVSVMSAKRSHGFDPSPSVIPRAAQPDSAGR